MGKKWKAMKNPWQLVVPTSKAPSKRTTTIAIIQILKSKRCEIKDQILLNVPFSIPKKETKCRCCCSWLPQNGCVCNHGSNNIRVHVRSWPSVLKVSLPCFLCVPPNSNRSSTVCNSLNIIQFSYKNYYLQKKIYYLHLYH